MISFHLKGLQKVYQGFDPRLRPKQFYGSVELGQLCDHACSSIKFVLEKRICRKTAVINKRSD
jgi:hypothetical protein